MITRKHILVVLLSCGFLSLVAAHILYDFIGDSFAGWYFRLYACGILAWAIRIRMQQVCFFDKIISNIVLWLCIFNVLDEVFSKTPAKPYKPWIASIVIITTTLYIAWRQSRKA